MRRTGSNAPLARPWLRMHSWRTAVNRKAASASLFLYFKEKENKKRKRGERLLSISACFPNPDRTGASAVKQKHPHRCRLPPLHGVGPQLPAKLNHALFAKLKGCTASLGDRKLRTQDARLVDPVNGILRHVEQTKGYRRVLSLIMSQPDYPGLRGQVKCDQKSTTRTARIVACLAVLHALSSRCYASIVGTGSSRCGTETWPVS